MVVYEGQSGDGGGGVGSGASFIWIVSCFLFVSILAGGGCLLMYIIIPHEPGTMSWLPITGVALVCLPWLFWFLTFIYRVISRISKNKSNSGGGAAVANINTVTGANAITSSESNEVTGDQRLSDGHGRGVGSVGGQQAHGNGIAKRSNSSLTNQSLASHESELPLASSMAS